MVGPQRLETGIAELLAAIQLRICQGRAARADLLLHKLAAYSGVKPVAFELCAGKTQSVSIVISKPDEVSQRFAFACLGDTANEPQEPYFLFDCFRGSAAQLLNLSYIKNGGNNTPAHRNCHHFIRTASILFQSPEILPSFSAALQERAFLSAPSQT